MVPIISVVGKSDSGKTTFIEKLIPELNRRGYRVATIKHDTHGFEIDREGKDTWRHAQAGAHAVIISSRDKMALIKKVGEERSLDDLSRMMEDIDLIITEGYKRANKPKIEVLRTQLDPEPLCGKNDNLSAIVVDNTDKKIQAGLGVPCFSWNDVIGVADHIEKKYLKTSSSPQVQLWVDNINIPLTPFVQSIMEKTIRGMVSSLKGLSGEGRIEIKIL
jgi:molybdopterin-guanine dinucleotide biosynthesis protein B